MREETRYICAYCDSAYLTVEECEDCENRHEIPVNITEFDYKKNCTKYPKFIKVKTINDRLALYQYVKPLVESENEEEEEEGEG